MSRILPGRHTATILLVCMSLLTFTVIFPAVWGVRRLTQGWIDLAVETSHETAFGLTMLLQSVGGLLCLAVVTTGLLRWSQTKNARVGPRFFHPFLRAAGAGVALGIGGFAFLWWFEAVPPKLIYRGLIGPPSGWFALAAMCAGALGGVIEEFHFRGFLLPLWRRIMPHQIARWSCIGVFALWHLWEYRGLYHLAFVTVLGYVCTKLAEVDRTWWRAAVCHAIQNAAFYTLANSKVLL